MTPLTVHAYHAYPSPSGPSSFTWSNHTAVAFACRWRICETARSPVFLKRPLLLTRPRIFAKNQVIDQLVLLKQLGSLQNHDNSLTAYSVSSALPRALDRVLRLSKWIVVEAFLFDALQLILKPIVDLFLSSAIRPIFPRLLLLLRLLFDPL